MISLHFSNKGWIEHVTPMELIIVNFDFQLEAIRTNNIRNISVYINNEPLLFDNITQKGQTGKSQKIHSLALVSNDKNKEIYYRIYTFFGFSNFSKGGTYVGISDDSDKILGFQYFIINRNDNPEHNIKNLNIDICKCLKIRNNTKIGIDYQINVLNNRKNYNEYISIIERIISNPEIKYVSFDIFDTLIERPVIQPSDIFSIVDVICKKNALIDNFKKVRNIETACRKFLNRHPSLDDIYNYMNKELGIDNNILDKVKKIELDCEFKLLKRRSLISRIYDYAVQHNKKIICVSDMYLSSGFLLNILNKEGYNFIERVFVSNEFNATKYSGSLFRKVLEYLNILPESLIHIGDNLQSDYKIPISLGICSFCIPSSYELFRRTNPSIFENGVSDDPMARIAVGYFINEYSKRNTDSTSLIDDLDDFIMLCIALPIVFLTLQICFNTEIQNKNKYKQILFASRDGYLIKRVYDIFKGRFNLLDSKYVYTGRKSYFSAKYETFESFCNSLSNDITPRDFINKFVHNDLILNKIDLSEINLDSAEDISIFLNKNQELLTKYYDNHRNEAKKYYSSVTSDSDRELIFDIGYSGSISSISYHINKIIDKIYFWQNQKNKDIDNLFKSKTFCLLKHGVPISLVPFEEFLSPLEGSTIGYINLKPILEQEHYSDKMIKIYSRISYNVCDITKKLIDVFDNYIKELMINDTYALFRFYHLIVSNHLDSRNFFNGCIMRDTFGSVCDHTLEFKMFFQQKTRLRSVFDLTAVKNSCYYNYNYDKRFYDLFFGKKIAIYLDIEDVNKIPYILTNVLVTNMDIYICAPHNMHSALSNLFASCNKFLLFDKLEGKESLFSWICNSDVLNAYDSVLVLTTAHDSKHYPFSEFLNNLNQVFSVDSVMQVLFMINDLNLAMLSVPFTQFFEFEFNDYYKLHSDKPTISLVSSFFSWCKKMLGSNTNLDDYPIELNEYTKLFNESFWYCPKKIPKELMFVTKFENCGLFTNQRLSVLIPVLLNRVNDLSFKYFRPVRP